MNHKQKTKLARKMMTQSEIKNKTSKFDTTAWRERRVAIEKRVAKREMEAKERARIRKAKKEEQV